MTTSSHLKRVVVATAGHVDHGKTSLMRVLTGTDTDRLPDEKRRGISIELGFAELPESGVSFIDVPGHEKLVHAMIAGVGGVDALMLVVAADDGVMPQTREHLWIARLLGVSKVVVAITKTDLVDAETVELATLDVEETLHNIGLNPLALIKTSAVTTAGVAELDKTLRALAERLPDRASSRRLWLPIDRIFSVKGAGTVITGTLIRGHLSVGQTVFVCSPQGTQSTTCRSLEIHGQGTEQARAATRVAANLTRLGVSELGRGDVIVDEAHLEPTGRLDVALLAIPAALKQLKHGTSVMAHIGATRLNARVKWIAAPDSTNTDDGAQFEPIPGLAQLILEAPTAATGGVGVVLRGYTQTHEYGGVLAGGRVIDSHPAALPSRKQRELLAKRASALGAISEGKLKEGLCELLELMAPRAIPAGELERRFGLEPGQVAELLAGFTSVARLPTTGSWYAKAAIHLLAQRIQELIGRYHKQHPHDIGIPRETVLAAMEAAADRALIEHAMEHTLHDNALVAVGSTHLATPAHATSGGAATAAIEAELNGLLEQIGFTGVSEPELIQQTNQPLAQVRNALGRLSNASRARRLTGLWFAETTLDHLRRLVQEHFKTQPELSVNDLKQLSGVSRKQAIPLLEQLDREGTTRRTGNTRTAGPKLKKD